MAGVYTEETLRALLTALNKNQIIDLFLETQEQTNTTIASLTFKRVLPKAGVRCYCY